MWGRHGVTLQYDLDDPRCQVCAVDDDRPSLLCDGCDGVYHLKCIKKRKAPEGDWFCLSCSAADEPCQICRVADDLPGVLCDECDKVFHLKCVKLRKAPAGDWCCAKCDKKVRQVT